MTVSFIFVMDIIGTIAFAISGAMVAIDKKMDVFGVNILAITTATGGGVFRDLLIGRTPPVMFQDPLYVFIAIITANVVFLILYFNRKHIGKEFIPVYERILFLCDALGLAAFTVDGVNAGMQAGYTGNIFLLLFLGTVTGVGGGVVRDVLAMKTPYIFVKHIYACASLAGAALAIIFWSLLGKNTAMLCGFAATLGIRALAAHYKWNLPRILQDTASNNISIDSSNTDTTGASQEEQSAYKQEEKNMIGLIVAYSKNRVIGNKGQIPWRIKGEQKRFKELTTGNVVIMGRKSYEEIGRPLPNRYTIVVSNTRKFEAENCTTVGSLEEAIRVADKTKNIYISGGAGLYKEAIDIVDKMFITEIDAVIEGDTYFPEFDESCFIKEFVCHVDGEIPYDYVTYTRK